MAIPRASGQGRHHQQDECERARRDKLRLMPSTEWLTWMNTLDVKRGLMDTLSAKPLHTCQRCRMALQL
jgi:hypothetical protein